MITIAQNSFLRAALLGDAIASAATGLLCAAGAGLLAGPLGLPEVLLRGAGLVLLPYAAAVLWLGLRESAPRAAIVAVIAANVLWVLDSLLLLASGWVAPTGLGTAFVIVQALAVAGFAAAQSLALRGSGAPAAQRA